MKILMIMAGFFPGKKYGGPPVSVDNFCTLMSDCECYIVTTNHDLGENSTYKNIHSGWNDRGNCKVCYLSDSEYQKESFDRIISEVQPDFMYLQGLFQQCIIPCLALAKKHRIRVLLAPRGELCAGAFRKKYKKVPYIFCLRILGSVDNIVFQSTSDEETESIQKWLNVPSDRIFQISNVPSIPKCSYPATNKETGRARFVFLSRIVEKKNLLVALSALKNVSGDVVFDIYGPIEDEKYWASCQRIIAEMPINIKVKYCGLVEHDNVHEVFSQYDAFVFPTHSENFGHVIAEALSVGTYAIISDQTPFTDVENYACGKAISLERLGDFSVAMQAVIDWDQRQGCSQRENAKQYMQNKLNLQQLKGQYSNIFN